MSFHVRCGEIDRDNNPVAEPKIVATSDDRAAAQAFIEAEIARFDHNGFVPAGHHQAGWWGRNDRDRFEKFHFWVEGGEEGGAPAPVSNPQYRGLP
jgi:hypothetical protein